MLYLLLATLFSAGFGLVVRHAQHRAANMWTVGALNYLTAALLHTSRALAGRSGAPAAITLAVGIVGGVSYVGAYFFFFPFVARRGVSVATAVIRLGVMVPVVVSVAIWGEEVAALQSIGVLLAVLSLPLLTLQPKGSAPIGPSRGPSFSPREAARLAILCLANGMCMLSVGAFEHYGPSSQASQFLALLFGTAAAVGAVGWLTHRRGSSLRDLVPGVMLGLCNALGNLALVQALGQLPGVIVFPFYSAVGILLTALFAQWAWHEPIRRLEWLGMAVALTAVVFVNL